MSYTAKDGDTWEGLARELLGDARRASELDGYHPQIPPQPGQTISVPVMGPGRRPAFWEEERPRG